MLNTDKLTVWKWHEYYNILERFLKNMEEFQKTHKKETRTQINYDLKIVMKIVNGAGMLKRIGGPNGPNSFGNIFNWYKGPHTRSGNHTHNWQQIIDNVEETIGWFKRNKWRSYRNTLNPIYWLLRYKRFLHRKTNEFLNVSIGFDKKQANKWAEIISLIGSICSILGLLFAVAIYIL